MTSSWPDDAIEVGRIADAWGVKGWIKVQPFSSEPDALLASKHWFLKPAEVERVVKTAVAARPLPQSLAVTSARKHGEAVVAQVEQVADRNGAEALRGARIFVSRASFPSADADEYYWVDLIGLAVVNRDGVLLGTVADLIDTGPHTVLRVVSDAAAGGAAAAMPTDPAVAVSGGAGAAAPVAESTDAAERLIPFVAAYVDDVSIGQRRITVDWGLDF